MRDGIILTVADDGTARVYYDTYDIVIHCESQEWRDKVKERIMGIKPKTTGSGFNHGEKDENWEARTTDDTISRQAAIDALSEAGLINYAAAGDGNGMIQAVNVIKGLPSAQPETIIESDESIKLQNSNDTISRQAAIRWVKSECNPYGKPTLDYESGIKVIEHLERMPSAQSETHDKRTETHACDLIDRQAAIDGGSST